jgi:hypothetical protein
VEVAEPHPRILRVEDGRGEGDTWDT